MSTTPTSDPVVEQKSLWEDILDVFFSPVELFRRRANGRLAPPLITLLLLSAVFYYVLLPAQTMVMRAAMEAQAASMPEGAAAPPESVLNVMKYAGGIMQPIMYLIMITVLAFVLWALCRLVGARPAFRQMMIVTTFAGFIGLLGATLGFVMVLLHGEAGLEVVKHMSFGALRFTDPDTLSKPMQAFLGLFELFVIWQAVIWGIGVYVITGVSKGKAAMVAGIAWLLMLLPGMLGAMFGPGAGGGAGGASVVVE